LILSSEYPPVDLGFPEFQATWEKYFLANETIDVLVGYVSTESLNYLDQLIDIHPGKKVRLLVGMAMFDGVSNGQKHLLMALSEKLRNLNSGGIYISQQFPFHGKIHCFGQSEKLNIVIVGSSNLSNIVPQTGLARGNFEIDLVINDQGVLTGIEKIRDKLFLESSSPIEACEAAIPIHLTRSLALRNHEGATQIQDSTLASVLSERTGLKFHLPLKTEEKSSLNVYFGKGRATGAHVRPRNWYEAALIVDKKVVDSKPGYPKGQRFIVYTDDGFRFVMGTRGTNSKNLESFKDLTTFGRWLKGRLEDADSLQTGTKVTAATLLSYGRNHLTLEKTTISERLDATGELLDVWVMDFSQP
jgi:hypothetical protein